MCEASVEIENVFALFEAHRAHQDNTCEVDSTTDRGLTRAPCSNGVVHVSLADLFVVSLSLAASLLFPWRFLAELLRFPCGGFTGPFRSKFLSGWFPCWREKSVNVYFFALEVKRPFLSKVQVLPGHFSHKEPARNPQHPTTFFHRGALFPRGLLRSGTIFFQDELQ